MRLVTQDPVQDVCRIFPEAERTLPSSFERSVARHRLRTALGSGAWQPSYEELNASANRLARYAFQPSATGPSVVSAPANPAIATPAKNAHRQL